jgi:nitrogen fixation NifU-like protein
MDELSVKPELYHPDILAYARDPARWRKEHDAQYVINAYNPVCGDKFEIRLDIDGVIVDTSFFGYGCVVSKASTALLTELLMHKHPEEARAMVLQYISMFTDPAYDKEMDRSLLPFLSARAYPGRIQCAILGWKSLLEHAPLNSISI